MEPLRKLLKNQNSEKTTEQIFSEVFADQDVKAFLDTLSLIHI